MAVGAGIHLLTRPQFLPAPEISYAEILQPEAPLAEDVQLTKIVPLASSTSKSGEEQATANTANTIEFVEIPAVETLFAAQPWQDGWLMLNNEGQQGLWTVSEGGEFDLIIEAEIVNFTPLNNTEIAYQKLGKDAGIYVFDSKTGEHQQLIATQDSQVWRNVVIQDQENYWYIQPNTGKFVKITKGKEVVLDQKVIESNNYTNQSGYAYLESNPDLGFIATHDLLAGQLLLIPVESNTLGQKTIQRYTLEPSQATLGPFMSIWDWSMETNTMLTKDCQLIDMRYKKLTVVSENLSRCRLSTDGKVIAGYDALQSRVEILSVGGAKTKAFAKIDDLELTPSNWYWLGSNKLILFVGETIYSYDMNKQELFEVSRGGEQAVVGASAEKILLIQDNQLFELRNVQD